MAGADDIRKMKIVLREDDAPFFSDEELHFYLEENKGKVNDALYQCLCIKAENSEIQVSGLNMPDSSKYFRRLANMYRPTNSGVLRGV